jgi:hypothetical protein
MAAVFMSENRLAMLVDEDTFGDYQTGVFEGVTWECKRTLFNTYSPRNDPRNTRNTSMSYWCGYIDLKRLPTDDDKNCMLENARECTYEQGTTIGFACNCGGRDYPTSFGKNCMYRTFPEVRLMLETTITKINNT